jgi:hypothetical protein
VAHGSPEARLGAPASLAAASPQRARPYGVMAGANQGLAAQRARGRARERAARLAHDRATCNLSEKSVVRAGGGCPLAGTDYSVRVADRRAARSAQRALDEAAAAPDVEVPSSDDGGESGNWCGACCHPASDSQAARGTVLDTTAANSQQETLRDIVQSVVGQYASRSAAGAAVNASDQPLRQLHESIVGQYGSQSHAGGLTQRGASPDLAAPPRRGSQPSVPTWPPEPPPSLRFIAQSNTDAGPDAVAGGRLARAALAASGCP